MSIVIHTISGKQYAYDHHRVGNRIETTYLYPVGKEGAKRPLEYKPGEGKRFKQHKKAEPVRPLPMKRDYMEKYGETLDFKKVLGVGYTALYAGEKVTKESLAMIEKVFNALPVYAQKGIDNVELFGESNGINFKVGEREFGEGGHWSSSEKTMRAFNTWSKQVESSAVSVYWHEAGHNIWHKLESLLVDEEWALRGVWDKSPEREALTTARITEKHEYHEKISKWEDEKELLRAKAIDLQVDSLGLEDMSKANRMLVEADTINDTIKATDKKFDDWFNQIEGSAVVGGKYDSNSHFYKWVGGKERPVKKLLDKWWDVTESEGGLTDYSSAYVKSGSDTAANENFAEAFKHWGSKAVGLSDNPYTYGKNDLPGKTTDWEQEYEVNFEFKSRTKAAFNDIIDKLTPMMDTKES